LQVQDRGLAAYIAELVGTLFLTFMVTSVVVLYVSTGNNAQFGSDFAVVGLAHAIILFLLVITMAGVSGGHFNPAVTVAAAALRRIDPIDAIVYILAQLSGGVLGALLTKALLLDEGRASDYGAAQVSALLGGNFQGFLVEGLGTFLLVLAVVAVAFNPRARNEWAPLAIGLTLGGVVMVFGPLTGAAVNPARWFGPALVGNHFTDAWAYIVGPLVGAGLAAAFYKFVIEGSETGTPPTSVAPGQKSTPAPPSPPTPPYGGGGGGSTPPGPPKPPPPPTPPQPPSSPPGGIVGS
jgi:MIP family channel proteins